VPGHALSLSKGEPRISSAHFAQMAPTAYLDGRQFLLDGFSVADAYLLTVLNWKIATPVDLEKWPAVAGYYTRLKQQPSIARALSEEHALYAEEVKRHKAASRSRAN